MAAAAQAVQNPAYRRTPHPPSATVEAPQAVLEKDSRARRPRAFVARRFWLSAAFSKDMTVEQAFKAHAGARRVFAKFHLGGCSHCAISETETVEQVSQGYGIPLDMLMGELERLNEQPALAVGDKVRLPDEIRAKIPQLATVPEIGEVQSHESGAYTVEFGEVRL